MQKAVFFLQYAFLLSCSSKKTLSVLSCCLPAPVWKPTSSWGALPVSHQQGWLPGIRTTKERPHTAWAKNVMSWLKHILTARWEQSSTPWVCSCLQDFQKNYYCSTATQCSGRFQHEQSSFTQIWSEHYKVRFWFMHWIRGWRGSWLNCCLILLFPTQSMCSPLKPCCSFCGPPKILYQLLSWSICKPDLVSFIWARTGNLTKPNCTCFLFVQGCVWWSYPTLA